MKAYTTIEESKQLTEAGLDVDAADMHFIKIIRDTDIVYIPELLYDDPLSEIDYPCWSLAALLDIINNNDIPYRLRNNRNSKSGYILSVQLINHKGMNDFDEVIDCITWLLENNYIKSNKNE